jgi:hypothetical protein
MLKCERIMDEAPSLLGNTAPTAADSIQIGLNVLVGKRFR